MGNKTISFTWQQLIERVKLDPKTIFHWKLHVVHFKCSHIKPGGNITFHNILIYIIILVYFLGWWATSRGLTSSTRASCKQRQNASLASSCVNIQWLSTRHLYSALSCGPVIRNKHASFLSLETLIIGCF